MTYKYSVLLPLFTNVITMKVHLLLVNGLDIISNIQIIYAASLVE